MNGRTATCECLPTNRHQRVTAAHPANIPRTPPFVYVRRHVDSSLSCRKTGLRRDFRPEGPPQASDLGKLWISLDFRARM